MQGNLSVVWIKLWDIILSLGKLLVLFKRQSNPQNDFVFSQWLRKFDGFKPITYVFFFPEDEQIDGNLQQKSLNIQQSW